MSTYLDVKEAVAENLGKTDGATYSTKREGAIKRARRKYYSETNWSFLRKVAQTLTFTSQVAPMPTDMNDKFNPACVYTYSGNVRYEYRLVDWNDLSMYGTLDYVYAIDNPSGTIKVSQSVSTLSIDYTYLPADYTAVDGSQDTSVEPAKDTTAIELLATAYFFMSSRQSKGSYAQFLDGYKEQLQADIRTDAQQTPVRYFRQNVSRLNRGYQGAYGA